MPADPEGAAVTRSIARVLALVLALTAVAGPVAAATEARGGDRVRVRIVDNRFRPRNITIQAGTVVKWVNRGNRNHTSTSTGSLWNSGILNPDESFRRRFRQEGTFDYRCTIHASMTGTITVN
jgi:plastocyanin